MQIGGYGEGSNTYLIPTSCNLLMVTAFPSINISQLS